MGEVSYKGHRYPAEIIAHCVWLYHRFPLSFREVEELMLVRGVIVTYETIRQWCAKFGPVYAAGLRRRQPRPGDTWHLDEVFLTINGRRHYLWRAVDQDGNVLDILVQPRRDAKAAKRFFRKLLKKQCACPRVLVTDKLRSYQAAHRAVMPSVEHRQSRYLNNRAENSHQPTRQRERAMKRFSHPARATIPGGVQRHLAALSAPSAPAVGGRLPTGDGRPLRGLERDHRGDDHDRRLNRRLGQDVSSKPRLITSNHHIGQLGWLKLTVPL